MTEQGLSQEELARRATVAGHKLHGEQVSMALAGTRPARNKAEALAAGLGVSLGELLEEGDDTDPVVPHEAPDARRVQMGSG